MSATSDQGSGQGAAKLQLLGGGVLIAFAPIFVKAIDLGPTAIGAGRCGIAAAVLYLAYRFRSSKGARRRIVPMEARPFLFLAGSLFALDLYVWHRSVIYAGAGLSTLLGNTQAIYLALVGALTFRESRLRVACAVTLGMIGVTLASGLWTHATLDETYKVGVYYGLSTGVVYACFILCLRKAEKAAPQTPSMNKLMYVSAIAALWLTVIAGRTDEFHAVTYTDFALLVGLALVAQIGGWVAISNSLPRVPIAQAGIILLVQPIGSIILGMIIFGESLSPVQWLGCGITLSAIYLSYSR